MISLSILGLTQTSFGQAKQEWNKIFADINKEVLEHSNAYTSLKIASETIGHRLTGSENGKKQKNMHTTYLNHMDSLMYVINLSKLKVGVVVH